MQPNKSGESGERLDDRAPFGLASGPEMEKAPALEDYDIAEWARRELQNADAHVSKYREDARQAFQFVSGDQYDAETRRIMRINRRPDTAFNAVQKYVRYVAGLERRSPQKLCFEPAVIDDEAQQVLGDWMTNVYEWCIAKCGGSFERSRAFEDMLIAGIGWTNTYIDRQENPKGMVKLVRVPWHEMLWDECETENLRTTRWRARESLVDKREAKRRWPDYAALIEASSSGKGGGADSQFPSRDMVKYTVPYIETEPIDKERSSTMPSQIGKVCITEFQWYEDEPGFLFSDPGTGEETWLSTSDFHKYERRLQIGAPNVRLLARPQTHRVVRVIFMLNRRKQLSEPMRLPGDRFSLNAMTSHWDDAQRQWYGFVRLLIDPQRYANKFFNQLIEIIAVSAKGGAIVEEGAFKDPAQLEEFKDSFSMPGSVSVLNDGALKEGKFMPKPIPEVPAATMAMLEWCIRSMESVTGISSQSLGLGQESGDAPALTMRQQQQAGTVLLAHEFDALSRYRIDQEGPSIVCHLPLIADGRVIRVGGQMSPQAMQLLRDPFSLDYDLLLDDTDHDPTLRQHYANFLLEAGPFLSKQGMFVPEMLDYLPLPAQIRTRIKKGMEDQKKQEQAAAAQGINLHGRGTPRDPRETQAKIAKMQSDAQLKIAQAQATISKIPRDEERSRREDVRTMLAGVEQGRRVELQKDKQHLDRQKAHAETLGRLIETLMPEPKREAGDE